MVNRRQHLIYTAVLEEIKNMAEGDLIYINIKVNTVQKVLVG